MSGEDCRVCRIDGSLYCVLWGSAGNMFGPLCDNQTCPPGYSWLDGKNTPERCYCDWQVKQHDRKPCPTTVREDRPARSSVASIPDPSCQVGECKCSYDAIKPSGTVTSRLPGETCVICPVAGMGDKGYICTERGNRANGFGPLCIGDELGSQCTGKNGCICNWLMSIDTPGWRVEDS